MILVESTYWPLVVVGAAPAAAPRPAARPSRGNGLWSREDLRLAVVVGGRRDRAAHGLAEVLGWLTSHRDRLWRCVDRVAWVVEDETTRQAIDRWLLLAGDRLFRGEVTTCPTVRMALDWLEAAERTHTGAAHAGTTGYRSHR